MELYKIGMTIPVYIRLEWPQHETTCVLGADNMTYVTYAHTPVLDDTGKVHYSHVHNTINIWEKFSSTPIANFDEENRKLLPDINSSSVDHLADSIVFGEEKATKWQNSSWKHVVDTINNNKHLHAYPDVDPPFVDPPKIHIHTPLHKISTSSYKDVKELLNWILRNKFRIDKYFLVILFGDKQLVCRIWHLLGLYEIFGEISYHSQETCISKCTVV
jgi:hypothetical protein